MVKWIVDSFIFEDAKIPENAFKNAGIEFFKFDYIPFLTDKIEVPYSTTEPIVVYSSINAVNHLRSFYGCYYRELSYDCNVYMALLEVPPTAFLNHDHLYCTFGSLCDDYNFYYDMFGMDELFFRPNKGRKEFTGYVISRDMMRSELSAIEYMYNMEKDSMILVSTPKAILEETRFIIGNREILGASRYRVGGELHEDDKVDQACINFVNDILKKSYWVPDDLFVIDIAVTEDGPKIVELNAFSCAGWYAGINQQDMIEKVSKIVERNFNNNGE